MIIIGITGTLGAGKGTIVEFLTQEKGFNHYSVRDFIVVEILKRGLTVNRDTMTLVANDLRAANSPSYIVDQLFVEAKKTNTNCVIESIRTPGEIESLRKQGKFYLFAVDAGPEVRFERIRQRRSSTDHVDYETFIANETREMDTADPNRQNLKKCISMADFVFSNNGSVEELKEQVSRVLSKIDPGKDSGHLSKRYCLRT